MGSVFEHIPIEKAAEALGVKRRQVYNLIKNGRLRTFKDEKKQLVYREDVARIIKGREERTAPVSLSRDTVRQHEARIHMLEKRVSFLMRLHDLHNEPLNSTAVELKRFYDMAEHCLATNWSPQLEITWRDFFVRIQLGDLEKLHKIMPDANPWLVFHSLCRVILRKPFDPDNELQLKAGKAHLETLAYVWSTTEGMNAKEIENTIKKDEKRVNKVVRRVTAARVKK